MAVTLAPAPEPFSAEKLFTETRNSCTDSAFGVMLTTPPRTMEVTLLESSEKRFCSARPPAFMFTPYSGMKTSTRDCAYACVPIW